MLVAIRMLLMLALTAVTVAPHAVHAAPAAVHRTVAADDVHQHNSDQHEDADHESDESMACCASLSVQCGGPAVTAASHWTPAERRIAEHRSRRDRGATGAGAVPEFEPPPPRLTA